MIIGFDCITGTVPYAVLLVFGSTLYSTAFQPIELVVRERVVVVTANYRTDQLGKATMTGRYGCQPHEIITSIFISPCACISADQVFQNFPPVFFLSVRTECVHCTGS